jgi:putative transposase
VQHRQRPTPDYRTYGASRALRHPDAEYSADLDIHIVIAAGHGAPFREPELAAEVCRSVEVTTTALGFRLYGYCLMPDHLHVLLSPAESGRPLSEWLQTFKSYTAHWAKRNCGIAKLWQRSCYDHICREGEDAERVLDYIRNNPVRRGLVDCVDDWPWGRSLIDA